MKSLHILLLFVFFSCSNTEQKTTTPSTTSPKKDTTQAQHTPKKTSTKNIVFFGDSITAAYGLEEAQGYTAHIQARIDSLGLDYQVVNAGLSGETSAGGVGRINWILKQPIEVFVLELGGNDGLRGIAPETTYQNLTEIADRVRTKYPEATLIIAGMEAPPNMGKAFTDAFRGVFRQVAAEQEALLIPFLLENVGGIAELNQADGIHPTARGHRIVADNVWAVLKKVIL